MRIDEMHYQFLLGLDRVASNDRPDLMPWEIDQYLNQGVDKFIKDRYSSNNELKRGFEADQKRISELSNLHIKSPEVQPFIVPSDLGNGRYEVKLSSLGNNIAGQYFRYLFLTKALIEIQKDDCTKLCELYNWQIDDSKNTYNQPDWTWCRVHGNFGRSTQVTPPVVSGIIADIMSQTADIQDNSNLVTEVHNNDKLSSLYLDTTDSYGVSQFEITKAYISYIKYPNRVFVGGYNHIDKHSTSTTEPIHCDIDESFHNEIIRTAVQLAQEDIQDEKGFQISSKTISEDKL